MAAARSSNLTGAQLARLGLILLFGIMAFSGMAGAVMAQGQRPPALVAEVNGVINPVKERYLRRVLERAAESDAPLVIIRLDTPGGLLDSTRAIVELLLESETPTAVYVAPRGAQAGSAGTFIAAAANVAAMAPGANIGAATPVAPGGREMEETLANKVTNDAAALIRSIAQERGRNQDMLEDTVRRGASFTATEAVAGNVVDFLAADQDDLLAQLHGREVQTRSRSLVLDTEGLPVQDLAKNPLEHFLEFIADPNVAFILLTLGGLGLLIELFSPGLIAPGVVGAILLILAFIALGSLPVNWAGVVLIVLAMALAALETQVAGFGFLGVAAILCLVLGGFLLFFQFGAPSPTLPPLAVNPWLLAGTAAVLGGALFYLLWAVRQSRREEGHADDIVVVGQVGTVVTELAPRGVIRLEDGNWTAVTDNDTVIAVGERVVVIEAVGLTLTVIPYDAVD